MTGFLFLAILGLGLMLYLTRADLALLHQRVNELERRVSRPLPEIVSQPVVPDPRPEPEPEPEYRVAAKARRTATVVGTAVIPPAETPPPSAPEPEPRPSPFADMSFESLVGGKLPIWVGGISLVFAGFFLVRYTIEAGLFGPAARSVTATLFALLMIAISEFGGRLPKIGASFTADPRVGQSLAGAGVATLYGTLYMASEIYGLVVLPTSFILVLIVTAIAFALSLRHGPPTALMGLTGGFAAPWVAGMGASNLPTLLLYLAVFIAALFGLAIWRRWLWLLVLASGGGALWSAAMLFTAQSNLGLLGLFITVSGGAAVLAALRINEAKRGWAEIGRFAPIAVAFVQLAALMPMLDFSATGWLFFGALAALTVALAWRDKAMLPLAAGALLVSAVPLAGAWIEHGPTSMTLAATFGLVLLFGGAGHIRGRGDQDGAHIWALIGLAAPVLGWYVAAFSNGAELNQNIWGVFAALAALPGAYMAWQRHTASNKRASNDSAILQVAATFATGLMVATALMMWIDEDWMGSVFAVVALGVAAWAKHIDMIAVRRLAILPLTLAMLALFAGSFEFISAFGASLSGERAFFAQLPGIKNAAQATLLPSILLMAATWTGWFATGPITRKILFAVGGAGLIAFVWLIAKQPAAISTPGDFIRLGFAERAIFTQMLFALGWVMLWQVQKRASEQRPDWPSLRIAGWALAGIALFRVVWFDLLLLNPVMVAQAVGPVPVANLLTGHLALVALWLWLFARDAGLRLAMPLQGLSLGAMIVTVLASIRQAVQGNLVSGASVETGENYFYSAGLLALALAWLVQGIMRGAKLMRIAGLSLLTAVTLKVFLIDAAALTGLLRILSFLGLGIVLIGIGWAYGRVMGVDKTAKAG
ncbi:MAG: DUF2339 domain-containing protein [Sphingorhabdus sp.]